MAPCGIVRPTAGASSTVMADLPDQWIQSADWFKILIVRILPDDRVWPIEAPKSE